MHQVQKLAGNLTIWLSKYRNAIVVKVIMVMMWDEIEFDDSVLRISMFVFVLSFEKKHM